MFVAAAPRLPPTIHPPPSSSPTNWPPASLVDLIPRRDSSDPARRRSSSPSPRYSGERDGERGDSTPTLEFDAAASDRFQRLRAVRSRLAKEKNLPPYCICHDSTLKL